MYNGVCTFVCDSDLFRKINIIYCSSLHCFAINCINQKKICIYFIILCNLQKKFKSIKFFAFLIIVLKIIIIIILIIIIIISRNALYNTFGFLDCKNTKTTKKYKQTNIYVRNKQN